jgi:hypothetical protein
MCQKQYEPELTLDKTYEFTLSATKPTAYFRLSVPHAANSTFFEVDFQACSGLVQLYRSFCRTSDADCDNGSGPWFPDASNSQYSVYTVYGGSFAQPTQTFGRIRNLDEDNFVHFFGVHATHFDAKSASTVQVMFRTYDSNSIAHRFINSDAVTVKQNTFSWQTLEYCGKASAQDPQVCEKKIDITPIKYTVYVLPYTGKAPVANLGTACGIMSLAKGAAKTVSTGSKTSATLPDYGNGDFIVAVGGDVPDPKHPVDYAYQPHLVTYIRTTSYKPVGVLIVLVLIAAVIVGLGTGGYYLYKKRLANDESVPLR